MSLSSRLNKLEDSMSEKEIICFTVEDGDDPEEKKAQAIHEHGKPLNQNTIFVRINKV